MAHGDRLGYLSAGHRTTAFPAKEAAGGLGLTIVIGRSADVAVLLTHLDAYSDGLAFAIQVRTSPAISSESSVQQECVAFVREGLSILREEDVPVDHDLSAGLLVEPAGARLTQMRGWGGGVAEGFGLWEGGWFLSPFPAALSVVGRWPARGIATSRVELDQSALREARDRVVRLF